MHEVRSDRVLSGVVRVSYARRAVDDMIGAMRGLLLACLVSSISLSCGEGAVNCTSDLQPAITIEAVDAETGAPICDASVVFDDGYGYVSEQNLSERICTAELSRVGDYDIVVAHPDYETESVQLSSAPSECGLSGGYVVVRLTPL